MAPQMATPILVTEKERTTSTCACRHSKLYYAARAVWFSKSSLVYHVHSCSRVTLCGLCLDILVYIKGDNNVFLLVCSVCHLLWLIDGCSCSLMTRCDWQVRAQPEHRVWRLSGDWDSVSNGSSAILSDALRRRPADEQRHRLPRHPPHHPRRQRDPNSYHQVR